MDLRSRVVQAFVGFFKKDNSGEVLTPERYLELAKKCMEHANRMTSTSVSTPLQFNHGQCVHLANKLEVAVQSAEYYASSLSPEITAETVGIVKLLCRCAKEVETFIQSCRQANWVQAAVVLSNVSEHVASLSFDLDFSTILFRNNSTLKGVTWAELVELDSLVRTDSVNETVTSDQRALLSKLEAMNQSSNSNDEKHQLSKYLLRRLLHHLSRTVESKVWEIDFSSLRQVQRLGSGSAGTVRKSTWLGAEVAEKMFYGTEHPSFRNEVQILAGLAHPNIVPLLGYAMDESRCSIVMELMDGDLLFLMEERVRQNPTSPFPFTTSEAVDLILQTAEGMLYLHDNKVVHRDLKSQNILVKRRNETDAEYIYLKVADFGLSKTKERSSTYSNPTSNIGTTRWMAPELIPRSEGDLGAGKELRYPFKVDVYSFGMVCYEIMTGKVPFATITSFSDIKNMVLRGERPELPDHCPPDLRSLIHACWDSVPRMRPSFVEICKRLRHVKYLLMRGSGVTIGAHQVEYEKIKEREAHQKEREARQKKEKLVRRKEKLVHSQKYIPAIVQASKRDIKEAIDHQREIAERESPARVKVRETSRKEREARQQEREEREAPARQKIREARQKELEERKEREAVSREKIREALARRKEREARQKEREARQEEEEREAIARQEKTIPAIVQASKRDIREAIDHQREIAERESPARVKVRKASRKEREARQHEREEREAPARQKIREARQKELEERKEREAVSREKIREALARRKEREARQ